MLTENVEVIIEFGALRIVGFTLSSGKTYFVVEEKTLDAMGGTAWVRVPLGSSDGESYRVLDLLVTALGKMDCGRCKNGSDRRPVL